MNKLIITIMLILIAAIALTVAIGTYFLRFALLRRDFDPAIMPDAEMEGSLPDTERKSIIKANREKLDLLTGRFLEMNEAEEESITSADGLRLEAEFYDADSHLYVILIHGYKGNRSQMRDLAAAYSSWGFNALLPDNRAHGESEGKWIGMGWLDKDDIRLWIDWIIARDAEARIVLHGISMGGATVMMTSGLDLPYNVVAAVEDCGYTSVYDIFRNELKALFHLPPFPILNMFSAISRIVTGYTPKEASSLEMLASSTIPMLFIHGDDDSFVGTYMVDICYDAKTKGEKEKLLIPDAGHGEAYTRDPETYFSTVRAFVEKYI